MKNYISIYVPTFSKQIARVQFIIVQKLGIRFNHYIEDDTLHRCPILSESKLGNKHSSSHN